MMRLWPKRVTQRDRDRDEAARLREEADAQLAAEIDRSIEHRRRADAVRAQGRKNGFSEAMESLYEQHLGAQK